MNRVDDRAGSANQGGGRAPFLVGLFSLLAAGGYLEYARANGRLFVLKKPAPLIRELDQMRAESVAPYIVRDRAVLGDEMISELGTRQYIQWALENPDGGGPHWRRTASLFVTYYTGIQDQVPHVAEECWAEAQSTQAGSDDVEFALPNGRKYLARRVIFIPPRANEVHAFVYYAFIVNGDMLCDRNAVRFRMGRESERYLYYSKIELCFRSPVDKEPPPEMDRMAERLLGQIIPVLLTDHIPDVAALEHSAAAGGN